MLRSGAIFQNVISASIVSRRNLRLSAAVCLAGTTRRMGQFESMINSSEDNPGEVAAKWIWPSFPVDCRITIHLP